MDLGQRLKELLKKLCYTQQEMAYAVDIGCGGGKT